MSEEKLRHNNSWWIVSLATSVLCCSLFFIFFAAYLFSTREQQMLLNIRLATVEQRVDVLLGEVDVLRQREHVQQIQILPAPAAPPMVVAPSVGSSTVLVPTPDVMMDGTGNGVALPTPPAPAAATDAMPSVAPSAVPDVPAQVPAAVSALPQGAAQPSGK